MSLIKLIQNLKLDKSNLWMIKTIKILGTILLNLLLGEL